LPDVVLGPPHGAGAFQGSQHTLSLGFGGSVVLEFTDNRIVDGPGPDFTVFENAFFARQGSETGPPFAEPATVAVSSDGVSFVPFPCAATDDPYYPGCAGIFPVFANSDDRASPSPLVPTTTPIGDLVGVPADPFTPPPGSGGDSFDLAAVGLTSARFIRLEASDRQPAVNGLAGFDLDAVAAVNSIEVGGGACSDGVPITGAKLTLGKLATAPGDDTLAFGGTMVLPFPFDPPLDLAGTGLQLVIGVLDLHIPGGAFDPDSKTGWKVNKKGTVWTYSNPEGADGVTKVVLTTVVSTPGRVRFMIKGRKGMYAVTPGEMPLRAALVITAGQCGEAILSCMSAARGNTLKCK
jgi:hypothetical protein